MSAIDLPTMLNFKRSISQGRGLMFSCTDASGENALPLIVEEGGIRATKAYDVYAKTEKEKKGGSVDDHVRKAIQPNPQRVEQCFMPEGRPFLKTTFDLKYLSQSFKPYMCNNMGVLKLFRDLVSGYAGVGGFDVLGQLYVIPLVTGLWMWRNNDEALSKKIIIQTRSLDVQKEWVFTPNFNAFKLEDLSETDQAQARELGAMIGEALAGRSRGLFLNVTSVYEVGHGMQVYPSQEMITERTDSMPSRILYKVNSPNAKNQAGLHEQKIGNALRAIDGWHGNDCFGPQAVEPLGVVATHQISLRVPEKRDFYSICKNMLVKWSQELSESKGLPEVSAVDDLHYVVAVLVRGGAFV